MYCGLNTLLILLVLSLTSASCNGEEQAPIQPSVAVADTLEEQRRTLNDQTVRVGAERTDLYFPLLEGKNIGLVANQTTRVEDRHLADTMLASGLNLVRIYTPEHGFRGEAAAGEHVKNSRDSITGLPILSLYGSGKKPSRSDLQGIDIMVFDVQDVGARFYTYISTLHYVMEACAENNIPVLVLDRPNPNGFYVDGPVLEMQYKSFVGMHPVPIVHGMTMAEYARMINGEGWLSGGRKAELSWIEVEDYSHNDLFELSVRPSPNLATTSAIYLYPSLCLFEGTLVSLGRGTDKPFMVIGHPGADTGSYYFTPRDIPGVSMNPPQEGLKCRGFDLEEEGMLIPSSDKPFRLSYLITMYSRYSGKQPFFNDFFSKLAGNSWLRTDIESGKTEAQIRHRWGPDLAAFKAKRTKYLLYPDFDQVP